jgi:hypothetical protein
LWRKRQRRNSGSEIEEREGGGADVLSRAIETLEIYTRHRQRRGPAS